MCIDVFFILFLFQVAVNYIKESVILQYGCFCKRNKGVLCKLTTSRDHVSCNPQSIVVLREVELVKRSDGRR